MLATLHTRKLLLSVLVAADSRFHNLGPLFGVSLFGSSVSMTTALNSLQSIKDNGVICRDTSEVMPPSGVWNQQVRGQGSRSGSLPKHSWKSFIQREAFLMGHH